MKRRSLTALALALCALASSAHAEDGTAPADDAAIFAGAVRALESGHPGEAVDALEALADQGLVDPVASYDRGLAYAMRVRVGAEVPGDLGRAAQGFEEARFLTRDPRLADDATRALGVVRSEIARRRLRAGQPAEVEAGRSLARTLAQTVSEDVWSVLAVVASVLLALGLFVRWLAPSARARIGGAVTAGVTAPALFITVAMTLAARRDRLDLREAVVVSAAARPTDEHGLAVPGGVPLPEGALVELIDERPGTVRVRYGATDAWIASSAVRPIAK